MLLQCQLVPMCL